MKVRCPTLVWIPVAVVAVSMLAEVAKITPGLRWLMEVAGVGLWLVLWRREVHRTAAVTTADESATKNVPPSIDPFIDEVANAVDSESRGAAEEVARVRGLLSEAIATLVANFTHLTQLSAKQSAMVVEIVNQSAGSGEVQGVEVKRLAEEAGAQMVDFVTLLLSISKQSIEAVHQIDDVVKQVNEVFAQLGYGAAASAGAANRFASYEIRGADCAAVATQPDSHRSGGFSEKIQHRINCANASLAKVRVTIEAIAARDMTATIRTKYHIKNLLEHESEQNRLLSERINEVAGITKLLDDVVGNAVRSLQFEDITNQALYAADMHISRLSQLSIDLREMESAAQVQQNPIGPARSIERMRARVVERREDWRKQSAKPVSQTSMSAGGVDLF